MLPRYRRSVGKLASVRGKRNETDSGGIHVKILTDKAHIVGVSLVNGLPCAVVHKSLNLEGLEHASGESEERIAIRSCTEERHGNDHKVGVTVDIVTVKIGVDDKSEARYVLLLLVGVGIALFVLPK